MVRICAENSSAFFEVVILTVCNGTSLDAVLQSLFYHSGFRQNIVLPARHRDDTDRIEVTKRPKSTGSIHLATDTRRNTV